MDVIFALLVLFGIIALVLGMINPSLVVRWKDTPTRSNVVKIYGGLVVISFIAFSYVVPKVELTPEQKEKIAIEKQKQMTQDLEKKHLQKIAKEKRQRELEQKNKIAKEKEYQQKLIDEEKDAKRKSSYILKSDMEDLKIAMETIANNVALKGGVKVNTKCINIAINQEVITFKCVSDNPRESVSFKQKFERSNEKQSLYGWKPVWNDRVEKALSSLRGYSRY